MSQISNKLLEWWIRLEANPWIWPVVVILGLLVSLYLFLIACNPGNDPVCAMG